jgi:aminoglycoside N3'-acetyltransferase
MRRVNCSEKNNKSKRAADANFSHLLFGNELPDKHFLTSDSSSFGNDSFVDEIFKKDGYLGAIGDALEYLTEIRYLERKLNISYRFDKIFKGSSVNTNCKVANNQITYFCRDLESDYSVSFVQLKEDIRLHMLFQNYGNSVVKDEKCKKGAVIEKESVVPIRCLIKKIIQEGFWDSK